MVNHKEYHEIRSSADSVKSETSWTNRLSKLVDVERLVSNCRITWGISDMYLGRVRTDVFTGIRSPPESSGRPAGFVQSRVFTYGVSWGNKA